MSAPLLSLDPEQIDKDIKAGWKVIFKAVKTFKAAEQTGCLRIAEDVKRQMDEFLPHVPLVQRLCNPGMRDRHWSEISTQLGMTFKPDDTFTLTSLLHMIFTQEQTDILGKVCPGVVVLVFLFCD